MGSNVTISLLAATGTALGRADGRGLAVAALVSWLIAESLGAWMLGRWIASGGPRQQRARPDGVPQPDGVPRSVIFGHAGLALAGFACWVSFVVTGSAVPAWLAIGFLTPAIGLGISTVTVWTPYPARSAAAGAQLPAVQRDDGPDGRGPGREGPGQDSAAARPCDHGTGSDASGSPGHAPGGDVPGGTTADEMLARALADEALTSKLVDDLLARMLARPPSAARRPKLDLAPLIPVAHGILAIATFLLAMLGAVAAL